MESINDTLSSIIQEIIGKLIKELEVVNNKSNHLKDYFEKYKDSLVDKKNKDIDFDSLQKAYNVLLDNYNRTYHEHSQEKAELENKLKELKDENDDYVSIIDSNAELIGELKHKISELEKKDLCRFPLDCLYGYVIIKDTDDINFDFINHIVNYNYSFDSLYEIRDFLMNKANKNGCKSIFNKKGFSCREISYVYLAYYSDEIGKYKEKGNYIAVHVLKIINIGKDKIRTEQFYEKTSRPIKNCLQSLIGGIWEL